MTYTQTPRFSFSRNGRTIWVSFNNHPLKDAEGKPQDIHFSRQCESELEAKLLCDFMREMEYEMIKHYFTGGFNAHKKREKNYYL